MVAVTQVTTKYSEKDIYNIKKRDEIKRFQSDFEILNYHRLTVVSNYTLRYATAYKISF